MSDWPVTVSILRDATLNGVLYGGGVGVPTSVTAAPSSGQFLGEVAGVPTWKALPAISLSSGVSGILPIANGGTGAVTLAGANIALTTGDLSQFAATTSLQLKNIISDETGSGSLVFATSPTLVTPLLGTPTSGNLSNCTALPISSGISGLGTNVATFLATPSSANLVAAITDETGSGALVFATSPTLVTPILGVATCTSLAINGIFLVNKLSVGGTNAIPATSGTAENGTVRVGSNATGVVIDLGIYGSAYGWIQARDSGNYATNYDLSLQPNGGKVGIGTTSPGLLLEVSSTGDTSKFRIGNSSIAAWDFSVRVTSVLGTASGSLEFIQQNSNTDFAIGTAAGVPWFVVKNSKNVEMAALISKYNAVTTFGMGVPAIYKSGRSTAQTGAVGSVAAYTNGASDGSFIISANVNVTTSTTHNFTVTVAYTDEGNTARTLTLSFFALAGGAPISSITNITGAGPYEGALVHIRCKASTTITIATTGTFTTVTYNVEGYITQIG